jgi:hypothetical protein
MLAYNFTEDRQFAAKTYRTSVFLYRDSHILDWQYLLVPYMCFYGFLNNSNFCSKSIDVSPRFHRKLLVFGKNCLKLCISWLWLPYSGSVVPNCPVYVFLQVLEKSNFHSKSIGVSLPFYRKFSVCGKNWLKPCISWLWLRYPVSVVPNCHVYEFLRFLK